MPTWAIILLWFIVLVEGAAIVLLMAAVGHLHQHNKNLSKMFIESARVTDQNFQYLAQHTATIASILHSALSQSSEEMQPPNVKKVTPDGMLN